MKDKREEIILLYFIFVNKKIKNKTKQKHKCPKAGQKHKTNTRKKKGKKKG